MMDATAIPCLECGAAAGAPCVSPRFGQDKGRPRSELGAVCGTRTTRAKLLDNLRRGVGCRYHGYTGACPQCAADVDELGSC